METAIKIAIENGWEISDFHKRMMEIEHPTDPYIKINAIRIASHGALQEGVLDPLFWQALGKGLGWEIKESVGRTPQGYRLKTTRGVDWEIMWHRFIDHLAEGKDVDSFFTNLLTP